MDIHRRSPSRFAKLKKYRLPVVGLMLLAGVSAALSAYSPSIPAVASSEVWIGEVQRGQFSREVRGPGVLLPNQMRWLTARSSGRVEQIHELAGSIVQEDTLLLELTNPDLEQAASAARLAFIAGEAQHKALVAELAEAELAQEVRLLEAETNLEQAEFRYQAELKLAEDNIISGVDLNESRLAVQQHRARLQLAGRRSTSLPELQGARIAASLAGLSQLEEAWLLQQQAVAGLKVYAGINGVLQALPLEQGQQVNSGALLARVANPRDLRAELRIPETLAKDIVLELPVQVDIRNGTYRGRVARIDPSVENGTVAVDIRFTESLPDSARMDQSVDGAIQLEAVSNALYVERPASTGVNGYASLFRIETGGSTAVRTQVRTGATSIQHLQILEGLDAGDRIILSDLSRFQDVDKIEIK